MTTTARFTKIFVVVHGIGAQQRNATVRSVATRFARSIAYARGAHVLPLAPQPLGYFHGALGEVCAIDDPASGSFEKIGFSEIFWADLPQKVASEKDTLEETKAWARTIVARARNRFEEAERRHRLAEIPGEIATIRQTLNAADASEALKCQAQLAELASESTALTAAVGSAVATGATAKIPPVPPDFSLAAEVLDEIIETVYVLENLTFLADKAGLFSFDLREVLDEYVGDVQLVTEFARHRHAIVERFLTALARIHRDHGDAEIHIVAHSEGTVVAFLGLLLAMGRVSLQRVGAGAEARVEVTQTETAPEWLGRVRGFMTLGSPIDKHLLLWPRLWEKVRLSDGSDVVLDFTRPGVNEYAIEWRNYYDYGDPVGFRLDTARDWLAHHRLGAFNFCDCEACRHDIGFARYFLPGKAHNDYWDDAEVFDHFIRVVVEPDEKRDTDAMGWWSRLWLKVRRLRDPQFRADEPFRPHSKASVFLLSPLLPYLLSFALLTAGVLILYKAVVGFTHPALDPVQKFVWFETVGQLPPVPVSGWRLLQHVISITALVAGTTLLARLPRLAMGVWWWFFGLAFFAVGAAVWVLGIEGKHRAQIGCSYYSLPEAWRKTLRGWFEAPLHDFFGPRLDYPGPTLTVIALAFAVALFGLYQAIRTQRRERKRSKFTNSAAGVWKPPHRRRQRWFFRGMRPLIVAGGLAVSIIIASRLNSHDGWKPPGVTVAPEVAPVVAVDPPVWPVVLGGAAFLYLWWLAALIFDLGFVWKRYIRGGHVADRLRMWAALPARDPAQCCGKKKEAQTAPSATNVGKPAASA